MVLVLSREREIDELNEINELNRYNSQKHNKIQLPWHASNFDTAVVVSISLACTIHVRLAFAKGPFQVP